MPDIFLFGSAVFFDELFFFRAGEMLYVPFHAHGFFLCVGFAKPHKLYGALASRTFAGSSRLMRSKAFFDVVCPAAVVVSVLKFQYVSVIHFNTVGEIRISEP